MPRRFALLIKKYGITHALDNTFNGSMMVPFYGKGHHNDISNLIDIVSTHLKTKL